MKKVKNNIPYDYITLKTTKGRIEKGLLAIPTSLIDLFPKSSSKIFISDPNNVETENSFTHYKSSSKECRIGGLKNFYQNYNIKNNDEIVILFMNHDKIKLIPEKLFKNEILSIENKIDESSEIQFIGLINSLSKITNESKDEVIKREFLRLSNTVLEKRKSFVKKEVQSHEYVPQGLRNILRNLYQGKCQISDFTFKMKNGQPYFELHHIFPEKGNHFKNLLVVSPNIHAQFTFSKVTHYFDSENWLRRVSFNDKDYPVFQIIDKIKYNFHKVLHY